MSVPSVISPSLTHIPYAELTSYPCFILALWLLLGTAHLVFAKLPTLPKQSKGDGNAVFHAHRKVEVAKNST